MPPTKKAAKKLPVSGSEPTFTYKPYGTPVGVRSNNCTAYALQHYSTRPGFKLQPGELAGDMTDFSLATCSPAVKRVIADLAAKKMGYQAKPMTPCKKGYAKIMLLLDANSDYHFVRQNGDVVYEGKPDETRQNIARRFRVPLSQVVPKPNKKGTFRIVKANVWSHKRGTAFGPDLTGSNGQLIFDPRKASFDYGDYDYDTFCGAFCVKQKPCKKNIRKKI